MWVVAVVLAVVLLATGTMKLARTNEQLAASGLGWTADVSTVTVKLIGAAEVLVAIGLTLPAVLGVAEILVPLAALGLYC
ncbi:DoxX family protein [Dactylosporangium sp. NPDC000555]|uniref:DoxX family protein n=1 Tax=Dactylosporangium sp. NPDC000555 TaxID=3154260 RepID=UPI00332CDF4C